MITALLPLTALMLVVQTNPYHALAIRGILGAMAALVYSVLGAADVALTEALMGTLLAITLYAVAVRSSLVFRVGVLEDGSFQDVAKIGNEPQWKELITNFRQVSRKHHLRLEVVPYESPQALESALQEKEVHAICERSEARSALVYETRVRVRRMHEILQQEMVLPEVALKYVAVKSLGEK
jgi:putative multicomponent Na+:H+ antiporter subunit B